MFAIGSTLTYSRNVLLGTAPSVSTLCLSDATTHDQISQAFPFCIGILLVIKYWRSEWLGTRVTANCRASESDYRFCLLLPGL